MSYDYNNTGEQRSFDVIPDGTITVVQMHVRPGNAGEDGMLKRSKEGGCEGIDAEFIVVEGDHAKRKLWVFMIVSGTTDGHAQASDITSRRLKAIIESARGIQPTDVSEAAKEARKGDTYADFDGLRFMCKIGVEPAVNGYKAKNTIAEVITPDRKEWHPIEQVTAEASASSMAPSTSISKPAWA